jgi:hypothetical protein
MQKYNRYECRSGFSLGNSGSKFSVCLYKSPFTIVWRVKSAVMDFTLTPLICPKAQLQIPAHNSLGLGVQSQHLMVSGFTPLSRALGYRDRTGRRGPEPL